MDNDIALRINSHMAAERLRQRLEVKSGFDGVASTLIQAAAASIDFDDDEGLSIAAHELRSANSAVFGDAVQTDAAPVSMNERQKQLRQMGIV